MRGFLLGGPLNPVDEGRRYVAQGHAFIGCLEAELVQHFLADGAAGLVGELAVIAALFQPREAAAHDGAVVVAGHVDQRQAADYRIQIPYIVRQGIDLES